MQQGGGGASWGETRQRADTGNLTPSAMELTLGVMAANESSPSLPLPPSPIRPRPSPCLICINNRRVSRSRGRDTWR